MASLFCCRLADADYVTAKKILSQRKLFFADFPKILFRDVKFLICGKNCPKKAEQVIAISRTISKKHFFVDFPNQLYICEK